MWWNERFSIMDEQPTNLQQLQNMSIWIKSLRNVFNTLLNQCQEEFRQFWRQKRVQPGTSKVPLSCGSRRIIQVDAAHWWWLRSRPPPPPPMNVKHFGCTAIHNKVLYKCIIHTFIQSANECLYIYTEVGLIGNRNRFVYQLICPKLLSTQRYRCRRHSLSTWPHMLDNNSKQRWIIPVWSLCCQPRLNSDCDILTFRSSVYWPQAAELTTS